MWRLLTDIRFALRMFARAPVITAVAVVSFALGIGANTAIFTLVDQVLLRALPIKNPEQLVFLTSRGAHYGSNWGSNALSYPIYRDFRDQNQVFSGMFCRFATPLSMSHGARTERVAAELVSGTYYEVLGVRAAAGRLITPADDRLPGAGAVAVLSYDYWQNQFGGNPNIIGQTIRLNSYPMTVIGVSQAGFHGVDIGYNPQIMAPVTMKKQMTPGWDALEDRRTRWVQVFARLKPGVTIEQAKASLQPIFKSILHMEVQDHRFGAATKFTKDRFLESTIDVLEGGRGRPQFRERFQTPLLVLMSIVALVLMIACSNVANLLLARATARQKEIALRFSLGATRGRIVGQLLTESVLLSVMGGLAGLLLAFFLDRYLLSLLPQGTSPLALQAVPDLRVFTFTLVISIGTGILFGLAPAFQGTRTELAHTLKDEAGSVTGVGSIRLRKGLVVAQVSLSLLLLIGAGLFVGSLHNLRLVDPGLRASRLISFSLNPTLNGYSKPEVRAFYKRLQEDLQALPGVQAVSLSRVRLLDGNQSDSSVRVQGHEPKDGENIQAWVNTVGTGYFATMGIPLIAGREFQSSDERSMILEEFDWTKPDARARFEQAEAKVTGAPKYAVVNERFARHYFGNPSLAVGRRFGFGYNPGTKLDIEIVGVSRDTMYRNLRDEIPRQVFTPLLQDQWGGGMTVYVRSALEPEQMFSTIMSAVKQLDNRVPIFEMLTVDEQIDRSLLTERMIAMLSSVFGMIATVLAMIGLYGVMAYTVTRRTREIGIRMALGALDGQVIWLVMKEVLLYIALGVIIGLPAALLLTGFARAQLYGLAPNDPSILAGATAVLILVAALAGYIPVLRASRISPTRALRYE
jgi:predicted permease